METRRANEPSERSACSETEGEQAGSMLADVVRRAPVPYADSEVRANDAGWRHPGGDQMTPGVENLPMLTCARKNVRPQVPSVQIYQG